MQDVPESELLKPFLAGQSKDVDNFNAFVAATKDRPYRYDGGVGHNDIPDPNCSSTINSILNLVDHGTHTRPHIAWWHPFKRRAIQRAWGTALHYRVGSENYDAHMSEAYRIAGLRFIHRDEDQWDRWPDRPPTSDTLEMINTWSGRHANGGLCFGFDNAVGADDKPFTSHFHLPNIDEPKAIDDE